MVTLSYGLRVGNVRIEMGVVAKMRRNYSQWRCANGANGKEEWTENRIHMETEVKRYVKLPNPVLLNTHTPAIPTWFGKYVRVR